MAWSLEVRLAGALLLGGGDTRSNFNATLRRPDGTPFIPASALKGAIREQLGRLVPRERVEAIFGREGCAVRHDGSSTGAYLGDAELQDAETDAGARGYGYATRTQVSIDRRTRRAADQRLFSREVVAPRADELLMCAPLDLSRLDAAQQAEFVAAASAVFALGAGRSGGLGAVELKVVAMPELAPAPLVLPDGDVLELVLRAEEPLCLGGQRWSGNFHESLGRIPASTLRGAIVSAALEQRGVTNDCTDDAAFRRLIVDPDTCLRFGEAVPVKDAHAPAPRRAPYSLRRCKLTPDHGVRDTLVAGYIASRLAAARRFVAVSDTCRVDGCDARTKVLDGWLGAGDPQRRVVTRLGLDPRFARGEDGKLFSLELVDRGAFFVARVVNVGTEGRGFLTDAARRGLRVGRGRGQGYGRVSVVGARAATDTPLLERLRRFDDAVRSLLAAAGDEDAHFFMAATLTSDALLDDATRDAAAALLATLDIAGAECVAAHLRVAQRGGYSARPGTHETNDSRQKPYLPALAAGSTVLLCLPAAPDAALSAALEHKERHGIGLRREEGFGWVRFSDDVHQPGWRKE